MPVVVDGRFMVFQGITTNHRPVDHIWHIKWLCNQLLSRGQCNTFEPSSSSLQAEKSLKWNMNSHQRENLSVDSVELSHSFVGRP